MTNKQDLKKQVIILSIVLVLVITLAIFLNTGKRKNVTNIPNGGSVTSQNNNSTQNLTQEEIMRENLKGLLEEPEDDDYIQEIEGRNETIVTTKSGETIIIKE